MKIHENPFKLIKRAPVFNEFSWILMDFHGFSWIFMDSHGFSWVLMIFDMLSLWNSGPTIVLLKHTQAGPKKYKK